MANRKAVAFMEGTKHPGREYPDDRWGVPTDPYPNGEATWFGGVEEAMRRGDQSIDLNAPKNNGYLNSILPLPSAFSANKATPDTYRQDPNREALEGTYPNLPVYTPGPDVAVEMAMAQRRAQHNVAPPRPQASAPAYAPTGAAHQAPAQKPPAQKAARRGQNGRAGLGADQVRDIVAQVLAEHKPSAPHFEQSQAPHMNLPLTPGEQTVAPFRWLDINEPGAVHEFTFHVDFGHVSPSELQANNFDKPANKALFEFPTEHFLAMMPANYNTEKGKYMKPSLDRAVIESITVHSATNKMPLNLLLGCDQLSKDHITGVHMSNGTTGLYIMRMMESLQPAKEVYSTKGKIKNTKKVAKYGGLTMQNMADGITFMEPTLDDDGNKTEAMASIPVRHAVAGVMKSNAASNKEIAMWIENSDKKTGRIVVPQRIYQSVANIIAKTVEDQMKPTDLRKLTFFITPSNGKPATDFSGTVFGRQLAKMTEAEKKEFLDTEGAVNAEVTIRLYNPIALRGNDEPKPYSKIDPALRME